FWREMDQIRVLVDVLVPEHVANGRGPIRIWSAACATGEEPLTLAMALDEAGWFHRADIEIWASDVSPTALEKARRGRFRGRSFRALPEPLKARYFKPDGDEWVVAPSLQDRVRFYQANLVDPREMGWLASARYIFCRNVFIYFSTPIIDQVAATLAERMPRPGYLFLGVSESLIRREAPFTLAQIEGAFVYLLGGEDGRD